MTTTAISKTAATKSAEIYTQYKAAEQFFEDAQTVALVYDDVNASQRTPEYVAEVFEHVKSVVEAIEEFGMEIMMELDKSGYPVIAGAIDALWAIDHYPFMDGVDKDSVFEELENARRIIAAAADDAVREFFRNVTSDMPDSGDDLRYDSLLQDRRPTVFKAQTTDGEKFYRILASENLRKALAMMLASAATATQGVGVEAKIAWKEKGKFDTLLAGDRWINIEIAFSHDACRVYVDGNRARTLPNNSSASSSERVSEILESIWNHETIAAGRRTLGAAAN